MNLNVNEFINEIIQYKQQKPNNLVAIYFDSGKLSFIEFENEYYNFSMDIISNRIEWFLSSTDKFNDTKYGEVLISDLKSISYSTEELFQLSTSKSIIEMFIINLFPTLIQNFKL